MQLAGLLEMEMDFFDAAIRRFKEMDDMLYDRKMYQRWRHFVESDFMVNTTSKFFMCNYMDGIFVSLMPFDVLLLFISCIVYVCRHISSPEHLTLLIHPLHVSFVIIMLIMMFQNAVWYVKSSCVMHFYICSLFIYSCFTN